MDPHPSIGESLNVLADVAGVPLVGLDDDQLDIVALRLVVEADDQPVLSRIGRIIEEVRQTEGDADHPPVPHERDARLTLIASHTPEDAATGIYPLPRRPEIPHPSRAGHDAHRIHPR